MPLYQQNGEPIWKARRTRTSILIWMVWLIFLSILLYAWNFISQQTHWFLVVDAPEQVADFIGRALPPNWEYAARLWSPLWDTINIATLGTILAIVISVPIAFLAARNTTPYAPLRQFALLVIVTSRSVNSLIWALLLVSILGPGLLAGTLAIALRAIGFVSKLLYEAIEEINPEAVEAISATGASKAQVLTYGVVPQVIPAFIGISVFRWDINIRESTIVGLVGAGGIGIQLNSAVNSLQWDRVAMIFIMIFGLVLISEAISAHTREAVS